MSSSSSSSAALTTHPIVLEMRKFESIDYSVFLPATITYLDLTSVHQWVEVRVHEATTLNWVYFCGRRTESNPYEIIIPSHVHGDLDISRLDACFSSIMSPNFNGETVTSVLLSVVSGESTVAYYRISLGLVPPMSLTTSIHDRHDSDVIASPER